MPCTAAIVGLPVGEPPREGGVEQLLAHHLGAAAERLSEVVLRLHDAQIACREGKGELVDPLAHLGEEDLARADDGAADHDRAGVEHVDQRRDRLADHARAPLDQRDREGVAVLGGAGDRFRGERLSVACPLGQSAGRALRRRRPPRRAPAPSRRRPPRGSRPCRTGRARPTRRRARARCRRPLRSRRGGSGPVRGARRRFRSRPCSRSGRGARRGDASARSGRGG